MHGRLVIPIHNGVGKLVAYCGRSLDQTQPRYRVPPAFAKSEVLFNMHRAACREDDSVVVVEGFFRLHESAPSRRSVGRRINGIGTLRTAAPRPLKRFRHVILFLDGDAAGRKANTVIAEKLRPYCSVRVVLLPDGVQPNQLPATDIGKVLQPSANDD